MTRNKIICNKAHEVTRKLWGSSDMNCFGNMEVFMQGVVAEILDINSNDIDKQVPPKHIHDFFDWFDAVNGYEVDYTLQAYQRFLTIEGDK